jgi:hypothetical protein
VILNWNAKPIAYTLPGGMKAGKLLLANVSGTTEADTGTLRLGAWEARIYSF